MRLPSLFTLDLFCYDTVANQNKGAALGESAAVALEGLARNQPDQANDVISNLSDLQKHPALAKQIEKAKAEQEEQARRQTQSVAFFRGSLPQIPAGNLRGSRWPGTCHRAAIDRADREPDQPRLSVLRAARLRQDFLGAHPRALAQL